MEEDKLKEQLLNIENKLKEAISKVKELIEELENNSFYLIECSIDNGSYHIMLQRTEFSKPKYFNFNHSTISYNAIPLFKCYIYYEGIHNDGLYYNHYYNNEELLAELRTLKRDAELGLMAFYNRFPSYAFDGFINGIRTKEKEEPEPIKPKGNPFAGESWKDRKHKFKGGR